jgi:hypothetical protein
MDWEILRGTLTISLTPVLVTGVQSAQVLGLKRVYDPTDVGSLDPRHKGEDEESEVGIERKSVSVSCLVQ